MNWVEFFNIINGLIRDTDPVKSTVKKSKTSRVVSHIFAGSIYINLYRIEKESVLFGSKSWVHGYTLKITDKDLCIITTSKDIIIPNYSSYTDDTEATLALGRVFDYSLLKESLGK